MCGSKYLMWIKSNACSHPTKGSTIITIPILRKKKQDTARLESYLTARAEIRSPKD